MVKLVFCCRRKPEMSLEEFHARWLKVHGPLVRRLREQLPMMRRYVQSHLIPGEASDALQSSRKAADPYDGITEVWFDDLEGLGASDEAAIDASIQLLKDEAVFLDLPRCAVFVTQEHEIF
jgi:hypothetical protein